MTLPLSRGGRRYGAAPSKFNPKDFGAPFHLFNLTNQPRPARAFLTGALPAIKDQKTQGSCTGHGGTSEPERLYLRWQGMSVTFSPAFLYYNERKLEGTLDQGDCGAQVVTSLAASDTNPGGVGFGLCPESLMPYNDSDCATAPSDAAYAAAKGNIAGAYHSIGNAIATIKDCILSDYSGVIGISVYDSFESDQTASSGLIPLPNLEQEQLQGGHEMHALIGYDDQIQCPNAPHAGAVLVQNSWGPQWGRTTPQFPSGPRGYAWISYDYIGNVNLCSDVRMSHLGMAW